MTREEQARRFVEQLDEGARDFVDLFFQVCRAEHLSGDEKVAGVRELVVRVNEILDEHVPPAGREFFVGALLDALEGEASSLEDREFMAHFRKAHAEETARKLLALAKSGEKEGK